MSNFLLGGRTGDLIHALWVVKNTPGKHELFITDIRELHSDGFALGLEQTYKELYPILMQQEWCKSFSIYNHDMVDTVSFINLSLWRSYAYSAPWTQLLANTFNLQPNGEPWITLPKITGWEDKIVIHCSVHEARRGGNWHIIKEGYAGKMVFVGNKQEYDLLGFDVPFYQPVNLIEHFNIINSCQFFIGNQSAPLAIAHALGKPRLAMLNEIDKLHYVGEEQWHKDYYWMCGVDNHFEGLKYL